MTRRIFTLTLLAGTATPLTPAAAQHVVGLGNPAGAIYGSTSAISADGTTIVGSCWNGSVSRAFRWRQDTGPQLLDPSGAESYAGAVSADGGLVFGDSLNFPPGRIFRWAAPSGPMMHLSGGSQFADASDDGAFVAASISVGSGSSGTLHAGRLVVGGQWQDLGVLAGHIYSESGAISADGSVVVGYCMTTQQVRRAFRWTAAGGMQDLGTLPGYPCSKAYVISRDGSTIAGICEPVEYSNPQRAFRWTAAGGMQNLGLLPGCNTASAGAMNADGTIVTGYSEVLFAGGGGPFVWTAQTGMIPLNTWLTSQGVNFSGWTIWGIAGFSADGRRLAGTGRYNGGDPQPMLITLPAPCYANCDGSTTSPVLTANDFTCFLGKYVAGESYANCDGSTVSPTLTANDFTCFLTSFVTGCS